MSILSSKKKQGNDLNNVLAQVSTLLSDQRGALVSKDNANMVASMESLTGGDLEQAHVNFENATALLESVGLDELITAQVGSKDGNNAVAMEAACLSLMAVGDAGGYHQQYMSPSAGASSGAITVEGDSNYPVVASMESFTTDAFTQFNAISVVVGALSLAQSSFDELFFPSEVVAAGQSGVEVTVAVPYAYNRTKRANNGTAFDFEKNSLVHAIEDHTILENFATDIYPHAGTGNTNGPFLVDPAEIGNETLVVSGVDIATRPLLFGKEIDLLGVSAHPGLIGDDVQDETDALDSVVSVGTVYIKVNFDDGTTVTSTIIKVDVNGMPGALFTRPAETSVNALTVNFGGTLTLNSETMSIANVSIDALDLHTVLGVTDTDDWNLDMLVNITGSTNTELANITMYANAIDLGNAYTGADKVELAKTSAEYTALSTGLTFELMGYLPKARRINANLRLKGIFIDNSEANKYYFPVSVGAPVSSVKPISSAGGGATVEGLVRALRTRSSNTAVTKLIESEGRIDAMMRTGSIQSNASTIGSLLVKPMYMVESLDVQNEITIHSTDGGADDLRALIIDKVTLMADKLALDSSYLSALENFVGGDKDYTVIIGTDPRIAGLIMRSGDERTLGFKHSFEIQSSLDLRMRNQIYISFKRKSQSGIDLLSYGSHLTMPALVHQVANSSNGTGVVQEIQVQPREMHTNTLPILGKLSIVNLDSYYNKP